MRSTQEVEDALEYFEQKLPSIQRNENELTVQVMETLVNTLRWTLNKTERL